MSKLPDLVAKGWSEDALKRADDIRASRLTWIAELRTKIEARKANPPKPSGIIMFGKQETVESIAEQLAAFGALAELAQTKLKENTDATWWLYEKGRSHQNVAAMVLGYDGDGKWFDAAIGALLNAETL